MANLPIDLSEINRQFPRSSAYEMKWVLENQMGPNVLWLAEALSQVMDLKSGKMAVELADSIPDGWNHWLKWLEVRLQQGYPYDAKEAELVQVDAGRSLGFTRVVARKPT